MSLQALRLVHPAAEARDLATYSPILPMLTPVDDGLRLLAAYLLGRSIHDGYENAVEDAQTMMSLFQVLEEVWERTITANVWPSILPPEEFSEWYT
ncbi:uncharacterized protein EI90DRAFT_3050819 [Cantharellus anzutake]|uniref:uncharacterized protein n=1 Tax=Cantharellus anzutake TaxID=1750568 RepID=UPI0019063562|nr:uncharacterized protein EI90DRAFT_3050819 [Cantharellus anzutake]KAF8334050.1 hypothetical protein EI90DRAFT_3050819 [Cantharellus anzutake]